MLRDENVYIHNPVGNNRCASTLSSAENSELLCFLVNARSVVRKMDELRCYVFEKNLDIICITESWCNSEITASELSIVGYECLRLDRASGRKGGGCLVFHKSSLKMSLVNELMVDGVESLWCQVEVMDGKIGICLCYKSPSATEMELDAMYDCIKRGCRMFSRAVVCGDFNCPSINWQLLDAVDQSDLKFVELVEDCFLTQHVLEATREQNILDLVLSSVESLVDKVEVLEHFANSDHRIVSFNLLVGTKSAVWKRESRNYRRGDYDGMRCFFSNIDWTIALAGNAGESWERLKALIYDAVENFVPVKRVREASKKPLWWNSEIDNLRKKKFRWWKRYTEARDQLSHDCYRRATNRATRAIRQAKWRLESNIVNNIKNDPKAFYRYAKSKCRARVKVGPVKSRDGLLVEDPKRMAEVFSEAFCRVFVREDMSVFPVMLPANDMPLLDDIPISGNIVLQKLKLLKSSKSPGVDGIHSVVLKECSEELAEPLAELFTKSLSSGIVPDDWKVANVTPIFKNKGSRDDVGNYRPVSLTSCPGKVMERIVRDALVEHLERHELIKGSQHGFTKKRSCLSNLLVFLEYVTKAVDEGKAVDAIYLDFSKAFDLVPPERLLLKLELLGIGLLIINWIRNWLIDRRQQVCIEGCTSEWVRVDSGVPQGSVLGPTLFLIYINDLEDGILNSLLKFADDTKLFGIIQSVADCASLQGDLNALSEWSDVWQMRFNAAKCKVIRFGTSSVDEKYILGGVELEQVQKERDLGVTVHQTLMVSEHCAAITKSANSILGMIGRTYDCKASANIVPLYKSLVRPILDYSAPAWRPYLQRDIDKIENVQKRALRMIHGCRDRSYATLLGETGLHSLEIRRLRADLIEVFKIIHGLTAVDVNTFFHLAGNDSQTRGHCYKIRKQHSRLNSRKYFFSNRVVSEWNNLSLAAVTSPSINSFKGHLDSYLKPVGGHTISQRRLRAPVPSTTNDDYTFTI